MSRSIAELLNVAEADRDIDWLEESLQGAVKLEFATIPLYLAATWSIEDPPAPPASDPNAPVPPGATWPTSTCFDAYAVLRGIAVEEMLHLGLVCNMLTTIGRVPDIVGAVPSFPRQGLPGDVRPDLPVSLAGLTKERVEKLFMQIEYPEKPVPGTTPPRPRRPGNTQRSARSMTRYRRRSRASPRASSRGRTSARTCGSPITAASTQPAT